MAERKTSYFRLDWHELREMLRSAILQGTTPGVTRRKNVDQILSHCEGSSWQGYTKNQLKEWLSDGYQTGTLHGLEDMIPPLREKRKFRFSEEGDELNVDLVLSGSDVYFQEWTKRESIPGIAIEAGIMFSAAVDARLIGQYSTWLNKIALSLESAGVDTEITLDFPSLNMVEGRTQYFTISSA
jgi:hypothetical protein